MAGVSAQPRMAAGESGERGSESRQCKCRVSADAGPRQGLHHAQTMGPLLNIKSAGTTLTQTPRNQPK